MTQLLIRESNGLCILLLFASLAAVFQRKANHYLFSMVLLISAFCLVTIAISSGHLPVSWQAPKYLCFGSLPITFHIDRLSAVFVALLGMVCIAVAFFSPSYLNHLNEHLHSGQYWSSFFLFILSMYLVILSADAVTFIVFWELMSLSSAALVSAEHKQHLVQKATLIYLGATRITTVFLTGGFLWMHSLSHSWSFVDWKLNDTAYYLPAFLLLLGFCIKAGIWPFHVWLPYAYPAAPAPVSALMSGVMIKIAFYGIIRVLVLGELNSPLIAYLAFFLGTVSAFWGILFALVQHDLKRLLAYSSVENMGLILMGIALALQSRTSHLVDIAALALVAAIFHCVNHGLFKSLLFLGVGTIEVQTHTRDLEHLGGLAHKMPWTMDCFLVGSIAICALPPLNGFASKWCLYQGLLRTTWESSSLIDRAISLTAIGILTIVGGLSLFCFTKAIGISFLGNSRSNAAVSAQEGSIGMIISQVILAVSCIALGVTVPYALRILAPICTAVVGTPTTILSAFTIPQATLALTLFTLVALIYTIFLNPSKTRQYITWECGFGKLSLRTQATAASFAHSVAGIFSPLLRYKVKVEINGKDRKHFPEHIKIEPQMVSLLESRVYEPALAIIQIFAKTLAKLQAGSIHLYLLYICCTLILLLLIGTRL